MSRYEHDGNGNLTIIASANESIQTEGHVISDDTTTYPARNGLKFTGVTVTNDTQNNVTRVDIPLANKMNTNGSNAAATVTFNSKVQEGGETTATGSYSHAEGFHSSATGNYGSHSEGYYSAAQGNNSHAEGNSSVASGISAHAEGYATTASSNYSHAEGYYTEAKTSDGAHAEGYGFDSTYKIIASGMGSHAEGVASIDAGVIASGTGAHAEGSCTTASGSYSHAEGDSTTASSTSSHAEGQKTIASSSYSHAEGYYTEAKTNNGAHAEGCGYNSTYKIIASGKGAHAEGIATSTQSVVASGEGSHAEGSSTTASGHYSHAEGYGSFANRDHSHAGGYYGRAIDPLKYLGNTTIKTTNEYTMYGFGTINGRKGRPGASNFVDSTSYNTLSMSGSGSLFTTGERTLHRGYCDVLVANGPRIVLEDGACYILVCNGRVKSTGAWRGAISYLIEATFNPLGTGTSTTAQAIPHIATLGTVGTVPVKLATETKVDTSSGTRYHSQLGIGSCTTAIGVRWNLYKVLGSEYDFPSSIS